MRVGSLFSGIGLLDYGLHLAGFEHSWLCESDPFRREILAKRFPGVPIFDDVRGVGAATASPVDVIVGGFPCKGVSGAGKEQGFGHPETVLWREMFRAIGELRPRYVLVENVAKLLVLRPPGGHPGDLWREVLGGLSSLGMRVVWDCLPAAAVGAPHRRDRVLAVASYTDGGDEGSGEQAGRERAGRSLAERGAASSTHPSRGGLPQHPQRDGQRRRGVDGAPGVDAQRRGASVEGGGQAPTDSTRDAEAGPEASTGSEWERVGPRPGLAVEWGDYEPAIRRWEQVHGPAPEPLVRRVDARGAARVERSRLSALGDGVQCQIGQLAGEYILDLEQGPPDMPLTTPSTSEKGER